MVMNVITRNISLTSKLSHRLIKFRYGASRGQQTASSGAQGTAATTQQPASTQSVEAIYDFQIPRRWMRKPLSEEEIAIINNGGVL